MKILLCNLEFVIVNLLVPKNNEGSIHYSSFAKNWSSVYFPRFRNFYLEGFLHLGIPIWRGPSIWEFLFGGSLISGILKKNTLFLRFLAGFFYCSLLFHQQFVCEMPLLQKKIVHLTFPSCRTANCKVPRRTGGHHFLLCQHTKKKT